MDPAWSFEHTIICPVSWQFAWEFWTNVANWTIDSDLESVQLDRAFETGARGVTQSRTSGRVEWRVAECHPGQAVIEFPAPDATGTFVWTFEDHEHGVRITQRASLQGERAADYADSLGQALEAGIPAGMQKLCEAMAGAALTAPATGN